MRDKLASAWVMIAGSLLIGYYYWRSLTKKAPQTVTSSGPGEGAYGGKGMPSQPPPGASLSPGGGSGTFFTVPSFQSPSPPGLTPKTFNPGPMVNSLLPSNPMEPNL